MDSPVGSREEPVVVSAPAARVRAPKPHVGSAEEPVRADQVVPGMVEETPVVKDARVDLAEVEVAAVLAAPTTARATDRQNPAVQLAADVPDLPLVPGPVVSILVADATTDPRLAPH